MRALLLAAFSTAAAAQPCELPDGEAQKIQSVHYSTATGTRHVSLEHRNFGEFKVSSLRNLESSAPYMHNGSLAGLRDVVKHYSELSPDRLHSDGEQILKPLHLTDAGIADLTAFLETLSDRGGRYQRRPFPQDCR
jgi:cytochrome c peroxidase